MECGIEGMGVKTEMTKCDIGGGQNMDIGSDILFELPFHFTVKPIYTDIP